MVSLLPPKTKKHQVARIEAQFLARIQADGGLSRVELARVFQLAPSTCGIYVNRLLDEGLLIEQGQLTREAGRPRALLTLNPMAGQFIGVDFDARNIQAVAIDFAQHPVAKAHRTISPGDTVDAIISRIQAAIGEVRRDALPLLGIGVGVPGLVDPHRGLALSYSNIEGWHNIDLAERLQAHFGVPVVLENNVHAMTLAELTMGRGRELQNFVCLAIRSGIGAGIIVDRALYRGSGNSAGEIGLWRCPSFGSEADSSNGTALQNLASVRAILTQTQVELEKGRSSLLGHDDLLSVESYIQAVAAGDALALEILAIATEALAWAVAQLIYALNPQSVIICGPLCSLGQNLLNPLRRSLENVAHVPRESLPSIELTQFDEFEGALGSASRAAQLWRTSPEFAQ